MAINGWSKTHDGWFKQISRNVLRTIHLNPFVPFMGHTRYSVRIEDYNYSNYKRKVYKPKIFSNKSNALDYVESYMRKH